MNLLFVPTSTLAEFILLTRLLFQSDVDTFAITLADPCSDRLYHVSERMFSQINIEIH